jgi:hypothetical protein
LCCDTHPRAAALFPARGQAAVGLRSWLASGMGRNGLTWQNLGVNGKT